MPVKKAIAEAQLPAGKGNCVLCAIAAERICQRCGDFYCSKDCQLKDWPRHRYICFPLPALVSPSSHSVHQGSGELSPEAACLVRADKTEAIVASQAPSPILNPNPKRDSICSGISNASSLTPKNNNAPAPIAPSINYVSNNSDNKAKNKITSPPKPIMPPSKSLVFITAFRSANRCCIRDASETADKAYTQMCEKVNAMGSQLPRVAKPRPGFCLAYHNGMFLRAKITPPYNNYSAKILFVDLGVVKSRSVSDMREINEELLSLPCFSVQVQLKDVPNYAITDEVIAFVSQFEGAKYVAVYQKTPGAIYVELIHPETNISLNEKINEFCANKVNLFNTVNKEPSKQQNSTTGHMSNKPQEPLAVPGISHNNQPKRETVCQDVLKKVETEKEKSFSELIPLNSKAISSLTDKNNVTPNLQNSLIGCESNTPKQTKMVSDIESNDPLKQGSPTKETVDQKTLKSIGSKIDSKSDSVQVEKLITADEHLKQINPTNLFTEFFRFYSNKSDDKDQVVVPREIFSDFLRSHVNAIDAPLFNTSAENNNTKIEPKADEIVQTSQQEPIAEEKSNKLKYKEDSNCALGLIDSETPKKDEKMTASKSSKPDDEYKDFFTKCLTSTSTLPSANVNSEKPDQKELSNLNEILDSLCIAKTKPQENGTVGTKKEPVLKAPFDLRRFSIESKDGINVYVVDNSKMARGIFGAFDSKYATEFSSLHSRLSVISDSEPYKPALREYILARFEDSWYRGRVEQIIFSNQSTLYRVLYLDYTNVEDISESDIRRYPSDFNTPCNTNLCVIEDFPHKTNAAQISYLSEALKVHQQVHVDDVRYINNIAMIKSRALINKLMSL
ncbi:uncharacterized protein LOC108097718 [Drosophila ficusphila]|uniref:uncharacterized protein LOC108097718 n=1 Tax=Drosophila ficusphila TaxID=30025 RepID=UPI0007E62FEC|nr:uncharacterized protein LOC108097718 [Drosophila ficusphila]